MSEEKINNLYEQAKKHILHLTTETQIIAETLAHNPTFIEYAGLQKISKPQRENLTYTAVARTLLTKDLEKRLPIDFKISQLPLSSYTNLIGI